jgi:RNA polymerase sporulation-specific sigma factor
MTNEELAISIQQGRKELIPALWEQVRKFIDSLARKYCFNYAQLCSSAGVTEDDLKQEGYFALIEALKAWTPESGCTFITFLKFPLRIRFNTLCGIRQRHKAPLNSSASLDEELPGMDNIVLGDAVPDPDAASAFDEVEQGLYIQKLHTDLEAALERVEPRSSQIIRQHYFEGQMLTAIGDNMGISIERVRQLKVKALRKLQQSRYIVSYQEEIISRWSYRRGSLAAFNNTYVSSIEFAVEELDRFERNQRYKSNMFDEVNDIE